jgi:hypothetical protein
MLGLGADLIDGSKLVVWTKGIGHSSWNFTQWDKPIHSFPWITNVKQTGKNVPSNPSTSLVDIPKPSCFYVKACRLA